MPSSTKIIAKQADTVTRRANRRVFVASEGGKDGLGGWLPYDYDLCYNTTMLECVVEAHPPNDADYFGELGG